MSAQRGVVRRRLRRFAEPAIAQRAWVDPCRLAPARLGLGAVCAAATRLIQDWARIADTCSSEPNGAPNNGSSARDTPSTSMLARASPCGDDRPLCLTRFDARRLLQRGGAVVTMANLVAQVGARRRR
jgi:hypothetical protein